MTRPTTLHIPQPCHESWDAMTPATAGRHCAACQQTVVDFTLKTDAEILAYLAKAAGRRTCGRFAAGQLERPLQRAAPAAPAARWRAWLAAAVAMWGLRETAGVSAKAQAPMEMRKMGETAVPEQLRAMRKPDYEGSNTAKIVLRGRVGDRATGGGVPGVEVLIKGTVTGTATSGDGAFELVLPAEYTTDKVITLQIRFIGYVTHEQQVLLTAVEQPLSFQLEPDRMGYFDYPVMPPAPWHPRSLYHWGKYWITRPFNR